jgi:phosphoribosyl-ATP pyrophosphohydrolase/phosphoribosyl-AMP cyclohydrolase
MNALSDLSSLDWSKGDGLLPAVVQDASTLQVLMLGYISRESLQATLDTGLVTFFSRSRNELWQKGSTSGNVLHFVEAKVDCDRDTVLILARPTGPVCHTGTITCFGNDTTGEHVLESLARIVAGRKGADPESSYTANLFARGVTKIAQKVGEEGLETALASVAESDDRLVSESADLLYHLLVLWAAKGVEPSTVWAELRRRFPAAPRA